MRIGGVQWTTLLDYPNRIAAVVFTEGCNLRCPYCHNPELVLPPPAGGSREILGDSFYAELSARRGFLDAVVVTGGEPTLQPDLLDVLARIKSFGYLTKLDTNGTQPEILERAVSGGWVDYVAMDVKAPLDAYPIMAGVAMDSDALLSSIDIVKNSSIDYEFRTTVAPGLVAEDLEQIGCLLDGASAYWLQLFVASPGKRLLDENCRHRPALSRSDLDEAWQSLRDRFSAGGVRG